MYLSDSHSASVVAVCASASHSFSKPRCETVRLLAGLGIEGDAHLGVTVKHRSRVARDPSQPNLRQVHLLQVELFDELLPKGFSLKPGRLGENITTQGLDLLGLPRRTRLQIGQEAIVEVTGLRNPCQQIDALQSGLMQAVLERDEKGALIRKAGVMGIVVSGGVVKTGDKISVLMPDPPYLNLEVV
ncbi:MAG: MOSC domain-containing protein [Hyphomicrobiaceae bacterium]